MGCNQSRKESSFREEEIKKLKEFFSRTANSYPDTKGKEELNVQAFKELFPENIQLGERLHEFMVKNSVSKKVDVEIFIEVLELIIRKPTNKTLGDAYLKHDTIGLLCAILFPHMRKAMKKKEYMNILISYSEALDLILTILHMFNASPDQKINDALSRSIVDRIFPTNDAKVEFWSFGMLIKEYVSLVSSLIHVYFKSKFLDGTVPFLLPQMADNQKQILIQKEQLIQIYLNNQYLMNSNQFKLLYQATNDNYNFDQLSSQLTNFSGQTFILLQFQDEKGQKYTVGGFNSQKWGQIENNSSMENYIFSLSPKYRHYLPVMETNQYSSYTKPIPTCYLFNQESFGREPGLVFGMSREDCRIWVDGKNLKSSFVKNTEKYFKKGHLIPPTVEKAECVLIEVYGVQTDNNKRMFTYSTINNMQLNQILAGSRDLRNSLTMNLDATRQSNVIKQSTYQTTNYTPYSTGSGYRIESDEIVKRSANKTTAESIYTPSSYGTTNYQTYTIPQSSTTTYTTTQQGSLPEYKTYYAPGDVKYTTTTYTTNEPGRYSSQTPIGTTYSIQASGQRNTTIS